MARRRWGLGLAAGLAGLGGCGDASAGLAGTVTYRGRPVTSGTVQVEQAGGLVAYSQIAADGRYRIVGAVPGRGKLGVSSPAPPRDGPAAAGERDRFGPAPRPAAPQPADDPTWVKLPDKYADPDTSGLEVTLAGGGNTLDLKLVD